MRVVEVTTIPPGYASVVLGWLFTIEDRQDRSGLDPGVGFEVWTEPPRLRSSGEIRRRRDGDPYTPAWDRGDRVVVFHPETDRCWAVLHVNGPAAWNAQRELFYTSTTIVAVDRRGPRLREIGVETALQGGRHRLTEEQMLGALRRFGLN